MLHMDSDFQCYNMAVEGDCLKADVFCYILFIFICKLILISCTSDTSDEHRKKVGQILMMRKISHLRREILI